MMNDDILDKTESGTGNLIADTYKERVFSAANNLVMNGIDAPTNSQIRAKLGSGSMSSIAPIMREWREQRLIEADDLLNMPESLKSLFSGLLASVWAESKKNACLIHEVKSDINEQELSNLWKELDILRNEVVEKNQQIKILEQEAVRLSDIENENIVLKTELDSIKVSLGVTTKLNETLEENYRKTELSLNQKNEESIRLALNLEAKNNELNELKKVQIEQNTCIESLKQKALDQAFLITEGKEQLSKRIQEVKNLKKELTLKDKLIQDAQKTNEGLLENLKKIGSEIETKK